MLRQARGTAALALFLCAFAACGDSGTEPEPHPTMTGTWSGEAMLSGDAEATTTLTISEADDGSLSGSGTFRAGTTGAIALSVTAGTNAYPDVSLTLSSDGLQDANFSGTFQGDDEVAGELNGSGFVNMPLTLERQ